MTVIKFLLIFETIFVLLMFIKLFFLKGVIEMVDMYTALVIAGRRTCNGENKEVVQVPTRYKQAVLDNLTALGLDADGNPII